MKIEELEKVVQGNIEDLQEDSKKSGCAFVFMTCHGDHAGLFAASGSNEQLLNLAVNMLHTECEDLQDDDVREYIEEMIIRAVMEANKKERESGDEHEEENHGIYS